MQSNARLQRALAIRQLGAAGTVAVACSRPQREGKLAADLRLFALTFAAGFLFTSIFIA